MTETEQPTVSVIIPCYNSGETLPQTLASLREQTYPLQEIIVIDDGSNDAATVALLNSLAAEPGFPLKLVRQINQGLPSARNTGFRHATSDYVLPLDSDDWLEPDAIAQLMAALQANPDVTFAYSWLQLEDEASGVLKKSYNFFEQLFLNQMPYCILVPRAAWKEIGGYDATMRRGYEDWEFNIRLGAHGKFGIAVEKPLFHYRVRSCGMLLAKSSALHGELWQEIQDRNPSVYGWNQLHKLWKTWKTKPSTYPLYLFFPWLALHRYLPASLFRCLFKTLLQHSQSRRISRSQAQPSYHHTAN